MKNTTYRNELQMYTDEKLNILGNNFSSDFYSKLNLGVTEEEGLLEEKMQTIRKGYRSKHETMRMPFPPAEPFYKVKKEIENCSLFKKVFKKMPKGGLLHVHSSASLSVDKLMELLESWISQDDKNYFPEIHIITVQNERQEKVAVGTLMYQYQIDKNNLGEFSEKLSVYLKTPYQKEWLRELLTFGSDRIKQFPYLWDEFNTIFSRTCKLFEIANFYYSYNIAFLNECIDDKINYVELRCGFEEVRSCVSDVVNSADDQNSKTLHSHESNVGYRNYTYHKDMKLALEPWAPDTKFLDILLKAEHEVRKTNKDFRLKVILCARRSIDPEKDIDALLKKLDAAIIIKNMEIYSELVIGFDFVSEEDRGQPTQKYVKDIIYSGMGTQYKDPITYNKMEPYRRLYQEKPRIQLIDFYLHDGESNWNDNTNIVSAAIVSRNRIGHGFSMNKIPGCIRNISFINGSVNAEPQYPILEICPISNQLLGYYPDLRNHSAYELMRQGILCCVSNDDPQIFDNPGLSYDYWEIYVGMWLDLSAIKGLVYNSYYVYSINGLGRSEAETKIAFQDDWQKFVKQALKDLQD